jgi:phage/plasmid-associated DNA primase
MGGDKEPITFLQKAFGYALTADVSEQVLFILHGTGANGKSTHRYGTKTDEIGGVNWTLN